MHQRAGQAGGAEVGALDRVDRDVEARAVAVAELLAVEEHRGVVLLALADDHGAEALRLAEHMAHRLGGGAVGGLAVAGAGVLAGGERRGAYGAQRQRLEARGQRIGRAASSVDWLLHQGHGFILAFADFGFKRNVRLFRLKDGYTFARSTRETYGCIVARCCSGRSPTTTSDVPPTSSVTTGPESRRSSTRASRSTCTSTSRGTWACASSTSSRPTTTPTTSPGTAGWPTPPGRRSTSTGSPRPTTSTSRSTTAGSSSSATSSCARCTRRATAPSTRRSR